MAAGQFDEAEAKARQAQRMNVVPSLTADRAEAVLHDIAMARARRRPGRRGRRSTDRRPAAEPGRASSPSARPTSCSPRATRRRPSAKFAEAERLRRQGGRPAAARPPRPRRPLVDPAVRQSGADGRARRSGRRRPAPATRRPRRARTAPPSRSRPSRRPTPRDRARPRLAESPANRGEQLLVRGQGPLQERQLPGRPADWPTRPRPASSASTPRPTSCSPRSPWPSRAGR